MAHLGHTWAGPGSEFARLVNNNSETRQTQKIQEALLAVVENRDIQETKNLINALGKGSVGTTQKTAAWNAWLAVEFPKHSKESLADLWTTYKSMMENHKKLRDIQRHEQEQYFANDPNWRLSYDLANPPGPVSIPKHMTMSTNGKTIGIFPGEDKYRTQPLEYTNDILWENFGERIVQRDPISKSLNIFETLLRIINEGTRVGLNPDQYARLFILFMQKEIPSAVDTAKTMGTNAGQIFSYLVDLINPVEQLQILQTALDAFHRSMNKPLAASLQEFGSLYGQFLRLKFPDLADKQIKQKLWNAKRSAMFDLIEPDNKESLLQWKASEGQRGNDISLDEQIDQAMTLEMASHLALKSPKRVNLRSIEISVLSIADTVYANQTKLGDTQSPTKTDRYGNIRSDTNGSNPPPPAKTNRSTSRGSQSPHVDNNYQRPQVHQNGNGQNWGREGDNTNRGHISRQDSTYSNRDRRYSGNRSPRRNSSPGGTQNQTCDYCKSPDHFATVCPEKEKTNPRAPCVRCGNKGHHEKYCYAYPYRHNNKCQYCNYQHRDEDCKTTSKILTPTKVYYQNPPGTNEPINPKNREQNQVGPGISANMTPQPNDGKFATMTANVANTTPIVAQNKDQITPDFLDLQM